MVTGSLNGFQVLGSDVAGGSYEDEIFQNYLMVPTEAQRSHGVHRETAGAEPL